MKRLSRSDRYEIVRKKVREAYQETRVLIEELQCRLDNMPENLRYSETGQAIEEAIAQLYAVCDNLAYALVEDIYFPGAYD